MNQLFHPPESLRTRTGPGNGSGTFGTNNRSQRNGIRNRQANPGVKRRRPFFPFQDGLQLPGVRLVQPVALPNHLPRTGLPRPGPNFIVCLRQKTVQIGSSADKKQTGRILQSENSKQNFQTRLQAVRSAPMARTKQALHLMAGTAQPGDRDSSRSKGVCPESKTTLGVGPSPSKFNPRLRPGHADLALRRGKR